MTAAPPRGRGRLVLLASVFIVAACGLVYELTAGAVSSYLLGDAVTQFSLVIGTFLAAMGVGSYLARFVRERLVRTFVEIEIWIGLLGGASTILCFAASVFAGAAFPVIFYAQCIAIGVMVGVEIPLLVRILKEGGGLAGALSDVLALDYLGALAGAIAFPLLALPLLGLSRASVAFGLLNLGVAAAGLRFVEGPRRGLIARLAVAAVALVALLVGSTRLVGVFEALLYDDAVIYARDTRYQRIVLTRWRDDVRLYLNGHLQFSSVDEARYHEALVIPAAEAAGGPRQVLILGGGDGLAAREVLKYPAVEAVTLVDIDPDMVALARRRREIAALNRGSLDSPKVRVVNIDAMRFLEEDRGFYDVVLVDLPDPESESLAKLYSTAFYELALRRLGAGGVLVTQAGSPFYAPDAFWCVVETIREAGRDDPGGALVPVPYHLNVPSFGEWGFVMTARRGVDPGALRPSVETRYLTPAALAAMFAFGKDMAPRPVKVNRLDDPVLSRYFRAGWRHFNE